MADFIPGYKPDIGPITSLPLYDLTVVPSIFRNIGNTNYYRGVEGGSYSSQPGIPKGSIYLGRPPVSQTYTDICGWTLYTVDGFGTKTDSGYALVWQFSVENSQTDWVKGNIRLVKRKKSTPIEETQLCSNNFTFGGAGGIRKVELYIIAFPITYDNKLFKCVGFYGLTNDIYGHLTTVGISNLYFTNNNYYESIVVVNDPNELDPDYPSKPGGGGGNHDRTSDPISVPGLPTIGAQSLGAVTMYKLTSAEIGVFGQEMTASDLWEAVKLFFQNPQDYIIGCALVPFTPPGDSVWYPKIGAYTFNHSYPIISSQFVEIDCGTLTIDEYWGSCFDYEPYTQITIWLPYIGYRAVPVDEIMNKSIYVKYHVDCLSGDCVAFVGVSSVGPEGPDITKILGQFSGNCAVQMPYGSVTFDSILSSGISMLSGAGVFAATGGNGGGDVMANSAMSMISGVKGEVQQGGTIGSSGGYMGAQKPYIIKRIRRQSLPENYKNLRGYPSNVYGTLSQLTGYAEVDDIQLNNIPAMEVERKEIIELLKGGVLL